MDIESGANSSLLIKEEKSSWEVPDNPEDDDQELKDIPPWTVSEIAVTGLATGTVAGSIVAMILTANPFVTVTGILGLLIPPYSAFQQQKITDIKAMQETNAAMERELNNLKYEKERLDVENEKLKGSVKNFEDLNEAFEEIREMENASLNILESQLQESEKILDRLEATSLNKVLQNIFQIIFATDKDENDLLSDDEIDSLIKRVEGINGVEINDELCKRLIIESGRNIEAVLGLVRSVLDNDPNTMPDGGENIIRFL